jgi:eukaryotic-like serine/threonine-protein kinase
LEGLLPFYDDFLAEYGDSTKLEVAAAKANRRVGDIRQRLEQYDAALSAYQRALTKYRDLQNKSPKPETYAYNIARIQNELGNVYRSTYDWSQAREAHESARDILEDAPPSVRQEPFVRYELARTHYFLSRRPKFDPEAMRAAGRRERRREDRSADGQPGAAPFAKPDGNPDGGNRDGGNRNGGNRDEERRSRFDVRRFWAFQEAREESLKTAVDLLVDLVQQNPDVPNYPHLLALCYREGSDRYFPDHIGQAFSTLEKLNRQFPDEPEYVQDLIETCTMIDARNPGLTVEELETAEIRLRIGLDYAENLIVKIPDNPDYEFAKLRLLHNLGQVLKRSYRTDEALTCFDEALQLQASLVRRHPDVEAYAPWQSFIHFSMARLFLDRREPEQARALLDATSRALLDMPDFSFGRRPLVDSSRLLEETLRIMGDEQGLRDLRSSEEYRRTMQGFYRRRSQSREEGEEGG